MFPVQNGPSLNKNKLESGPFQSWHTIAEHYEIHLEYYLNEKRSQFKH